MGITRRSLFGAGLAGVGAALENYSAMGIKRRQLTDQRNFDLWKQANQQQFDLEKMRLGELKDLQGNLIAHPDQAPFIIQAAGGNPMLSGVDLSPFKQAAAGMGQQQLTSALNTASSPEAMPADLGAALSARTGQTEPSFSLSNLPPDASMFGAQADYPNLPPELNTLANTAAGRLGQLRQAEEDKTNLLNTREQGKATATAVGTELGNHQVADLKTADEVQNINDTSEPKANAAGLLTGAQIDAGLTPERTAGEAKKAGDIERAKLAPDIVTAQGRAAGVKADAEARARLRAEYDPQNIAGAADRAAAIAKASAAQSGDKDRMKRIDVAKENGVLIGAQLQRLMNLYDQAAKGDVQAMSLYSDLSNNLRPVIARASGYNGRMTNLEMGIAGGAIPGLKDWAIGTAPQKFKFIRGLATYGPTIASQLPPDASIEEYMGAIQRLIDQEPAPSGKTPSGADLKPGSTLNRLLGQ